MADGQTQLLAQLYQTRPDLFTLDQADELSKRAQAEGVPFKRNLDHETNQLVEIPKQLLGGFVEGVTAFIDPFDKPKDTAGEIAHELGTLSGFVGSIFGLDVVGPAIGGLLKGAESGILAAEGVGAAADVGNVARRLDTLATGLEGLKSLKIPSVPMAGAEWLGKKIGTDNAAQAFAHFFGDSIHAEAYFKQASHLGLASGISALHLGIMPALQSGVQGALFGGVFGAIGDLPIFESQTTGNNILKAMTASIVQGLPSSIEGAPTAVQIKDYLLGAYFGWNTVDAEHYNAYERLDKMTQNGQDPRGYLTDPNYLNAPQAVKDVFPKIYEEMFKPTQAAIGAAHFMKNLGHENAADEILKQIKDTTSEQPVSPNADAQVVNKVIDLNQDYNETTVPLQGRLYRALDAVLGKENMPIEEYNANLENIGKKFTEVLQSGSLDKWADITSYFDTIKRKEYTEADLAPFRQLFLTEASSVDAVHGSGSADGLTEYKPDSSGKTYNVDRNIIETKRSPNIYDAIHGDPTLSMTVKEWRLDNKTYALSDLTFVDKLPEKQDSRTPMVLWRDAFKAGLKDGRYLMVNNGDKPMFKYMKYHPNLEKESKRIADAIASDPSLAKEFATGRDFDVNEKKVMSEEEYRKAVYSNILYAEDYLGSKFNELNQGDFIKTVLAYNKRQQPLFSDYLPGRADVAGFPGISTVLVEDFYKMNPQLYKENSDGAWVAHSTVFDALAKSFGLPEGISAIKPFVISPDEELGTLIGKMALHRASPDMDAILEEHGIDSMMPRSAAKQAGKREFNTFKMSGKKLVFDKEVQKYGIPIEHIKMAFGTYDNAHEKLNFGHRLAKQIMDTLTDEQSSPEARDAYTAFLKALHVGTKEANDLLGEYLKTKDPEILKKIFNYDASGELSKDSAWGDLGLQNILDAFKSDKAFRERARTVISRSGVTGLDDDEISYQDADGDKTTLDNELIGAMRLMKESDGSDAIAFSKPVKRMMENMMSKFFVKSLTSPKTRSAGKAVLSPFTPDMWSKLDLKSGDEGRGYGNFFLGDAFKKLNIKGIDRNGVERSMSLEEQWKEYNFLSEAPVSMGGVAEYRGVKHIEQMRQYLSSGQMTEERYLAAVAQPVLDPNHTLSKMLDKMRAIVLRVPMDDISGMQALDFGGFSGIPGGGMVIHGKNMQRLGGADLDIDTAFFYFGMPKAMHEDLYKNRNSQEGYDKKFPGAMNLLKVTADLPLLNKAMGMFDPYHRMKIGSEVAKGRNQNLGVAVANKATLGFLYTTISKSLGKDGYYTGESYRLHPRSDDGEMLRVMARAGIKMSADVGAEGGMVTSDQLRAILLHAAFDKIERRSPDGTRWVDQVKETNVDSTTKTPALRLSKELMEFSKKGVWNIPEYKVLHEVNAKLYGWNYRDNRAWNHEEIVQAAKDFTDVASQYPLLENHPKKYIIGEVLGKGYTDNNYVRFSPKIGQVEAGLQRLENILNYKQYKPLVDKLFPWLGEGKKDRPALNVAQMVARVEAIQDTPYELQTLTGRRELARNSTQYDRFVDNVVNSVKNEEAQKELRAKAYADNERYQMSKGEAFIEEQVNFASDMIGSRLKDMSSLMALKDLYDQSGMTPEFAQDILKHVAESKVLLSKDDPTPFNKVTDKILADRKATFNAAKEKGIDPKAAVDFYDGALHGSITNTSQTQYSARQNDLVPSDIIRRFTKKYTGLFNTLESNPKSISDVVIGHVEKEVQVGVFDKHDVEKIVHQTIQIPQKLMNDPITDKEVQTLVNQITSDVKHFDGLTAETFWGIVRKATFKAQPGDLDIFDLRGIASLTRKMRLGPGVFKELFGSGKDPKKWVNFASVFQFADTTADRLRTKDMVSYAVHALHEDGTFNDNAQPLRHWNEAEKMWETVYADTNTPLSHFGKQILIKRNSELHNLQGQSIQERKVDEFLASYSQAIHLSGTNEDHATRLFELAIARHQYEGRDADYQDALKDPRKTPDDIADLNDKRHIYLSELMKHDEYQKSVQNKSFDYLGKQLHGQEIVDRIMGRWQELMDWSHASRIGIDDRWVRDNIVVKNGIVDVINSYRDVLRMNEQPSVKEADLRRLTVDATRLMQYYDTIHNSVQDQVSGGKFVPPTEADVKKLNYGEVKDISGLFPGIEEFDKKGKQSYLLFLKRYLSGDHIETLQAKNMAQARALKTAQDFERTNADKPSVLKHLNTVLDYLDKPVSKGEARARLHNMERFSQYDTDLSIARREMSTYEYLFKSQENSAPLRLTGKLRGYFPHMDYDEKIVKAWGADEMKKIYAKYNLEKEADLDKLPLLKQAEVRGKLEKIQRSVDRVLGENRNPDGLITEEAARAMVDPVYTRSLQHLTKLGGSSTPGNLLQRNADIPGYKVEPDVATTYLGKLNNAAFSNSAAFQMNRIIRDMVKKKPFGDQTGAVEWMMRFYARDTLGLASIFPETALNDPTLQLKSLPYYYVSDQFVHDAASKMGAVGRLLFGKDFTPEKVGEKMRWFKGLEARYETAAILFSIRSMATIGIHGSINDLAYSGFRHIAAARDIRTWERINPEWKSIAQVRKELVHGSGAVEGYIADEGNILSRRYGAKWEKFREELFKKLRQDPDMKDVKLLEMAKEYGLTKAFADGTASMVRAVERYTRENAFMSTYLALRESLEPMRLEWDNPWLIGQAIKGLAANQYLHVQSSKSPFARTNLGQIFTRYKNWGWQSVKSRREIYDAASQAGFRPGSHEFDRLKRRMLTDTFLSGLAMLLPYSIFGSALPPPMSYFKSVGEWLFGDTKEKESAFIASRNGLPYALAPLGELIPPIARWPKGIYDLPNTFKLIWGNELGRIGEYTSYSLFPFGRMTKDLLKAYDNPERAVDVLTGIPMYEISKLKKRNQ